MTEADEQYLNLTPAEVYARYLVPAVFGPWTAALVDFLHPPAGSSALDVCCGTGALAQRLSDVLGAGSRIAGIDYDTGMIEVARRSEHDIEWHIGDAQALPFSDGEFDLVTCHEGLQFLPDRAAGLREMCRVLRADGQVGLAVWRSSELCPGHHALGRALGECVSPDLTGLPPFALGDADEVRSLLSDAGFREIRIEAVKRSVQFPSTQRFIQLVLAGASSKTREALARVPPDGKEAFGRRVEELLTRYVSQQGLEFPMEAHFVSAHSPT